ncbi:DegV family protein [Clostridium chauvoei]|uniref:DegV family protein n=2 Tax=Clostridium chauvoei TaxID=46867 RepID=A0ABD4RGD4_9CLOT|nr:DegV family protein [Clostridium chauvoei]ATD53848.1 fatty acid-binding protein DegV [Clostridium chauvoei]ATD58348.1 fatty acid-binding protein DegV [Clostridium chauvoei]MBX7280392.1 DegV family protein [Clostridium chauvoei]MBX7282877.1 DegV family protein [Clostridium chauvoei]MBX7285283.1 DegV family protein [Clostridium chauvoei]
MQKIALLTDSACDLSLETLKEKNIKLLPLKLIYSDREIQDKIDITAEEVYNNLENEVPKTSLPSSETIHTILTDLENEGFTHVIAITISSGLSGTFNAIRLALEDHPKLTSHVYDSKILALPQGLLVMETCKLIEEGKSFEEIVSSLPAIHSNITGYFTIDTLEYLKKGGRIGRITGTLGEILHLKPIITVDDNGVYYTICKARGHKQALSKLTDILKNELNKCKCKVWVLQGGALETAEKYLQTLLKLDNIVDIGISEISPALGVHAGPGLIGLAIQKVQ